MSSHQNGQTDPSNCYAYIFLLLLLFFYIYLFKYMHSEDSGKLVYLRSLISLHLRYMGNEHNTSLSY